MITDNGADFTRQLFLCFSAVDRKRYELAELMIWLVIADLEERLEDLHQSLERHYEPSAEMHNILESAICCLNQRVGIMNHQLEELDEHRPW